MTKRDRKKNKRGAWRPFNTGYNYRATASLCLVRAQKLDRPDGFGLEAKIGADPFIRQTIAAHLDGLLDHSLSGEPFDIGAHMGQILPEQIHVRATLAIMCGKPRFNPFDDLADFRQQQGLHLDRIVPEPLRRVAPGKKGAGGQKDEPDDEGAEDDEHREGKGQGHFSAFRIACHGRHGTELPR